MTAPREPARWPLATIEIGAGLFIVALTGSVILNPSVWLLHTLQALIYGAVILLARRHSPWGLGAGFTVALLWNGGNLFVTGFIPAGVDALRAALRTGHLARPALLLILVGAAGHFLMILGCLVGFLRGRPKRRQWAQFLGGAVLILAALALISPLRTNTVARPLDVARWSPSGGLEGQGRPKRNSVRSHAPFSPEAALGAVKAELSRVWLNS
jgi:hypothetical protein